MTITHSKQSRPSKPTGSPLFPHNNGQWCRKIAGKIRSFGKWENGHAAALEKHDREYSYIKSGVPIPESFDGASVKNCIDKFLTAKEDEADAGQITRRWFEDLEGACKWMVSVDEKGKPIIDKNRLVDSLGPNDFARLRLAIVKKHSPAIAKNLISRIKSIFKYAKEMRLITRDVFYGPSFKPPKKDLIRKHRAKQVKQLWEPSQIQAMVKNANRPMKAMILLGLNAGLNNSDLVNLPIAAIDFKSGWLDYPRAKTGIERRVKLWPDTLAAVKNYVNVRPKPFNKDHDGLLFVTRWGNAWDGTDIVHEFAKLLLKCDIDSGSFIWFRKTVQTIGERTGDIIAVRAIMGHVDDSMSAEYRQEIGDERLVKVTNCIDKWRKTKPKKRTASKGKRGAK